MITFQLLAGAGADGAKSDKMDTLIMLCLNFDSMYFCFYFVNSDAITVNYSFSV